MVLCVRFSSNWPKKIKVMQSATMEETMMDTAALVTIFWEMESFMQPPLGVQDAERGVDLYQVSHRLEKSKERPWVCISKAAHAIPGNDEA
jgi:hypothetical protein